MPKRHARRKWTALEWEQKFDLLGTPYDYHEARAAAGTRAAPVIIVEVNASADEERAA